MTKRAVRKPSTRRPAPSKRAPARRKARAGLMDQAVASLGISEKTLQRIATWGIVGLAGVGALGVASWFGLPAMAGVDLDSAPPSSLFLATSLYSRPGLAIVALPSSAKNQIAPSA